MPRHCRTGRRVAAHCLVALPARGRSTRVSAPAPKTIRPSIRGTGPRFAPSRVSGSAVLARAARALRPRRERVLPTLADREQILRTLVESVREGLTESDRAVPTVSSVSSRWSFERARFSLASTNCEFETESLATLDGLLDRVSVLIASEKRWVGGLISPREISRRS